MIASRLLPIQIYSGLASTPFASQKSTIHPFLPVLAPTVPYATGLVEFVRMQVGAFLFSL